MDGRPGLGLAILLLLAVAFVGMGGTVIPVVLGPGMERNGTAPDYPERPLTIASPLLLMLLVLCLGIHLPAPLHQLFTDAARLVEAAP